MNIGKVVVGLITILFTASCANVPEKRVDAFACNKSDEDKISATLVEPYSFFILSNVKLEGKFIRRTDNFGNEVTNNVFTTAGIDF